MACVYFKCSCDKSLAADAADAGRQVQCPDCGRCLPVPVPELYWTCACGEEMAAQKNLAGVLVQCATCKAEHTVPVKLELAAGNKSAGGGKRDQPSQHASSPDVTRVPVGHNNDLCCPKCGYLCAAILTICPQCQNNLRKGALIRRQCLLAARVLFIVGLGWFLAAHCSRINSRVKCLFSSATSRVESPSNTGNVTQAFPVGGPAGK